MQPLIKKIDELQIILNNAYQKLNIDDKKKQIAAIEEEMSDPDVWRNPQYAQDKSKQLASLQSCIFPWEALFVQLRDIKDLMALGDDSLMLEFTEQVEAIEKELNERKRDLLFTGKYDNYNAILRLSAGVGGTDAQDWTAILERMYLRWAEKNDMETEIIESLNGDIAGIKSCVIEVNGPYAFGKLKSEHGVHRLVRLSPFNSDNLRQTSFALVEVLPKISAPEEVKIDSKDIKIDVYRSGGHGGQSVNTTDSAVRVTHIPTGIVISIQNERSQLQNKETALKILASKLAQLQIEQHAANVNDLRAGESANWGSQIRNYVMHPYTLVKDVRTKYEEHDIQSVLDGKIDGFIAAYLDS
jgi:peptide chain release factor 2